MSCSIQPVILSGGSGTRLWPLSRAAMPKQFLRILPGESLFQRAVNLLSADGMQAPILICNEGHRFIARDQLEEIGVEPNQVVLEPFGRNTSAAVATVSVLLARVDPSQIMLVVPCDTAISDEIAFRRVLANATEVADTHIVTFGVVPSRAETGFGYIRQGEAIGGTAVFQAAGFVEKPDAERARRFLETGEYLWNAGMFLASAGLFLEQLKRFAPRVVECVEAAIDGATVDMGFLRLDPTAFGDTPSVSIDHAIMEQTPCAAVTRLEGNWIDLGSWEAVAMLNAPDGNGNIAVGDALMVDTADTYVRTEKPFVATLGVKNLVVVATDDAVLVADKAHTQRVKELVSEIAAAGRKEHLLHTQVYRPWGQYQEIDEGSRFKVKRITVRPGQSLSLQRHQHRAEHWVVVRGTASVTRDGEKLELHANESTFIPQGAVHRLANESDEVLELIEVQTGEYLSEDDIERLEDRYGR